TLTILSGCRQSKNFPGDGGHAVQAGLSFPLGLATDTKGNLYFADAGNHRIAKIDARGIITTIAGNGEKSFAGDGGQGRYASLSSPRSVAVDIAGNLYVSDTDNHRIRKIDPQGIITTIAGTGVGGFSGDGASARLAQLNSPAGIALDQNGNLFIAD